MHTCVCECMSLTHTHTHTHVHTLTHAHVQCLFSLLLYALPARPPPSYPLAPASPSLLIDIPEACTCPENGWSPLPLSCASIM